MLNLKKTIKVRFLLIMMGVFLFSANTFAQRVIEMDGTDGMKFTVEQIDAKPGEEITVKLHIKSKLPAVAMSHNFVLLNQGVDAQAYSNASARHKDNEFLAPDQMDDVIAHTKMGSGGQTVEVTFKAPNKAGDYDYVCTFPGHYRSGMKGVLTVK